MNAALAYAGYADAPVTTFTPIRRVPPTPPVSAAVFDVVEPDWLRDFQVRLSEVISLPIGWDGYRGRPTSLHAVVTALTFLWSAITRETPAPSVVPLSDGGIQLEWHQKGWDLELEASMLGAAELFYRVIGTGEEGVIDLAKNPTALRGFLNTITE